MKNPPIKKPVNGNNKKKPKKGITVYKRIKSGNDHRNLTAQKPKLPIYQTDITDTKNESILKLDADRTSSQRLLAKLEIAGQL